MGLGLLFYMFFGVWVEGLGSQSRRVGHARCIDYTETMGVHAIYTYIYIYIHIYAFTFQASQDLQQIMGDSLLKARERWYSSNGLPRSFGSEVSGMKT